MILLGDVRQTLPTLPDRSVQTCITSPPYFGLRDYDCDGQIGLEPTPREFVDTMVQVFREVRRVLRDDGTLWLNLGDSYAGSWGSQGRQGNTGQMAGRSVADVRERSKINAARIEAGIYAKKQTRTGSIPEGSGLKPKDLMGIPWRVAFALQDDGWYLRQDIIWSKPNPMPESVRDRCTKAHEYLFLLSKSARYYFDADAIAEPATGEAPGNKAPTKGGREYEDGAIEHRTAANLHHIGARDTRNKRSVWTIPTQPFKEAHFATFPPALVEPCIRAGSRPGDTVLDPFLGAGTTALVAEREGRQWIGCELNPDYAAIAERRLRGVQKPLNLRGAA
jgi:DNA modification methylase